MIDFSKNKMNGVPFIKGRFYNIWISLLLAIPFISFVIFLSLFPKTGSWFYLTLFSINLIFGVYCYLKKDYRRLIFLIFLQGIALKLLYITYTHYWECQHDTGWWGEGARGHFGYIYYLMKYKTLPCLHHNPNFPIAHPPLYYILAAMFFCFFNYFGVMSYEILQYLTTSFTIVGSIVAYLCLKPYTRSNIGLITAACFCNFFPFYIISSGSLNNDTLSIMLTFCFIFFFLRHLQTGKKLFFILSSLMVGLACLTKLSCLMFYIAIGLFYFLLWLKHKISWKEVIKKGILYSATLPLALSWSIYNFFKWHTSLSPIALHNWGIIKSLRETLAIYFSHYNPILHTELIAPQGDQDMSVYSIFDRLLPVFEPLKYTFILAGHDGYIEYNIWLCLIKTSLFDEFWFFPTQTLGGHVASFLLILGYILSFFFFTSYIHKTKRNYEVSLFSKCTIFTTLIIFSYWCFRNPVWSAAEFRYIAGIFPCMCLVGLFWMQDLSSTLADKIIRKIIIMCLFSFCILSQIFYVILGMK